MKQFRTQADDLKDKIRILENDLKSVNPELVPNYCNEIKSEIMELKSILWNIR